MKLKNYLKLARIRFEAWRYPFCCYWRVIYPDGKRTYLLPKSEADGLLDVYGGKIVLSVKAVLKSLAL